MSRITDNPRTILGARASTAGDVFHELWALRTALGLITPKTDLKAVTVEGIAAPTGSAHLYDGVDCGLFYGDISLERASRVEFVQLKYSTANPETAWTVARLTANSAKNGNNSVIRKLATDFAKAQGRIASGAKLIVKLISNQPLASEVAYAIAIIRAGDQSDPNAERFSVASGLSGQQLLAFLDALDVSDMGSGSRSALQDAIANELSQMSADKADTLVLQMQSHIRMLMLPEASQDIITSSTVLSWFGISTLSALFPAPADLQPMVDAIQRAPAKEVRDAFLAGNQLVCFYGLGGAARPQRCDKYSRFYPRGRSASYSIATELAASAIQTIGDIFQKTPFAKSSMTLPCRRALLAACQAIKPAGEYSHIYRTYKAIGRTPCKGVSWRPAHHPNRRSG